MQDIHTQENTQENIIQLTPENFRPVMLEESAKKLVVVYFWAPWDEASLAQQSVIEQFANQYPNNILLATVNCEEQQEIVAQFGVRGLPTTMLVKDGQPVDGFSGPQDLQQLEETFANHLPKPEQELFEKAQLLVQENNHQEAFGLLKQAYAITQDIAEITIAYADTAIETGNIDLSKSLISSIGLVDQTAEYHAVMGKIELAEKASESPELLELQAKYAKAPDDLQIKVELAVALQQAHKTEEGLTLLFDVLKTDLNFGEAKKTMLDIINALPDGDSLKSVYRRKVYSLLY
ncbi:tetratricopeptide repeat protein [Glaciecola petra]|uniref:Tetratricopeptide repeat protein n=1 Tax=Glaciecola petra TaxID=3075602 RepID=A0ABU2ZRW5_9ALTE|nr:tetratricopeptide repeat protein [Aestuariibacter sp. P117]MDT0595378.1 tetratricopeptide repeat protein [Aestuariibacter sp. P117]